MCIVSYCMVRSSSIRPSVHFCSDLHCIIQLPAWLNWVTPTWGRVPRRVTESRGISQCLASGQRIYYSDSVLLCQAGEELSDMSLLLKDVDDSANAVKLATRKIKRRLPAQDASTNPTPLVFGVDVSSPISVDHFNQTIFVFELLHVRRGNGDSRKSCQLTFVHILPNIDRFGEVYHKHTLWEIYNKIEVCTVMATAGIPR